MKIANNEASLVVKELNDGLVSFDVVGDNSDSFSNIMCETLQNRIADDKIFRDQILFFMDNNDEFQKRQGKSYRIKEFPIFHHFFTTLLIRENLTKLNYEDLLCQVGDYEVEEYCSCTEESCASVDLKGNLEAELDENKTIMLEYKNCLIILHFHIDGKIEMENLGDFPYFFPFRQELRDVFSSKRLTYGNDEYMAKKVVENFFSNLTAVSDEDRVVYEV